MIRAGIVTAAVVLLAFGAAGQTAPASGSFTISGVVRSATSGALLDRAEVTLSTAGDEQTQVAATTTGEGGVFRFDRLAAGKYVLAASRRGYIASSYQEHEGSYSTAIVTGAGLVSEGLRFNLFPTAVIDGAITDDNGDPVAGAQVTLYRRQQQNGQVKIETESAESTSDNGAYEFARLSAGTYYIGVAATPWYAFHPPQRTAADGTVLASDPPRSPLDVAYPMTFYANATDSASATPVQINAGDRQQLDLTLHAVAAVHVEILIPKPDATHPFAEPQLEQDVFGTEQFQPPRDLTVRSTGDAMVADLGGVAPGHYSLRTFGPNGSSHSSPVDLATDQTVDLSPGNTVDLSGKLEMASGEALPPVTMLQFNPGTGGTVSTPVSTDGSFDLRAIPPGDYKVQVNTSMGLLGIVQMAASGAEVHGHHITIASDPVLFAAEVARGSASIAGFARRDGKGIGGVLILLVPEQLEDNADLFRLDQSNSDGSFSLSRVVPGNYTLVAVENGWSLEWGRREVIAPYLPRGVKLHITSRQKTVDLSEPVEVQ